ncbi:MULTISPECIES: hypothetical protein [Bradyrhizobium]|uniref:Uncharacterized protein n=1 Tax=Bradyrhizobium septentrionale TaxID=1404411 RepID=A0A974A0C7_9BRAD|nr:MULTISPECIES: hypothetical protein [Bradyrhizobium]MCK7672753.1 hypothetical protein [Bradyrhizobium sp. 2S1]QIG97788.1 hypothetical protein G6P99_39410 [Bradyrhizobium sp. 6(2017)]UGY20255.1 hypothetical protein HAP48_0024230 [Bradyrhizobium septentrionale]UGY29092.1 hypothetical protein HU675_0021535 [Bradyrhizobium septentrionale]
MIALGFQLPHDARQCAFARTGHMNAGYRSSSGLEKRVPRHLNAAIIGVTLSGAIAATVSGSAVEMCVVPV